MSLPSNMTRLFKEPFLQLVSASLFLWTTLNFSFTDKVEDKTLCVTDFTLELEGVSSGNHTFREGFRTLGVFYLNPNFKTEHSNIEGRFIEADVQVTLAGKQRAGVRVFLLTEYSKGFWYNFIDEKTFSVEEELGLTDVDGLLSLTLDLSEKRYLAFVDQDRCLKPVGCEVFLCEL